MDEDRKKETSLCVPSRGEKQFLPKKAGSPTSRAVSSALRSVPKLAWKGTRLPKKCYFLECVTFQPKSHSQRLVTLCRSTNVTSSH